MPLSVDQFMRRMFPPDRWRELRDQHIKAREPKITYDGPLKFTDEARVLDPEFDGDE